jgi:hypothetical protein
LSTTKPYNIVSSILLACDIILSEEKVNKMRIPTNITELKIKRAKNIYTFYFDKGLFILLEITGLGIEYQCYKRDDPEAWELLKMLDNEENKIMKTEYKKSASKVL